MKIPTCFRAICVGVLTLACAPASAQYTPQAPRTFTLPESQPRTGPNLKARLAVGDIPFDKRYAELTAEEKNRFKSQYQSMADEDEPPFPVDGLGSLYKPIIEAVQSLRSVQGSLDMEVEVDSTGKASSVKVHQSPAPEVTQVAAAALLFHTYKPAICAGRPCAMPFPLRGDFIRR